MTASIIEETAHITLQLLAPIDNRTGSSLTAVLLLQQILNLGTSFGPVHALDLDSLAGLFGEGCEESSLLVCGCVA